MVLVSSELKKLQLPIQSTAKTSHTSPPKTYSEFLIMLSNQWQGIRLTLYWFLLFMWLHRWCTDPSLIAMTQTRCDWGVMYWSEHNSIAGRACRGKSSCLQSQLPRAQETYSCYRDKTKSPLLIYIYPQSQVGYWVLSSTHMAHQRASSHLRSPPPPDAPSYRLYFPCHWSLAPIQWFQNATEPADTLVEKFFMLVNRLDYSQ